MSEKVEEVEHSSVKERAVVREQTIVSWSGHTTLFWTLDMKNLKEKPKEQSVLFGS